MKNTVYHAITKFNENNFFSYTLSLKFIVKQVLADSISNGTVFDKSNIFKTLLIVHIDIYGKGSQTLYGRLNFEIL